MNLTKLISATLLMSCFCVFSYAEESSVGIGQLKTAIKSLRLSSGHLNLKTASPDLVAKEGEAVSSRRIQLDSLTGFDDVISSIRVSKHVISLNLQF